MEKHTRRFKGIDSKQHYKIIMLDIKGFYPSISKEFLTDALVFAETMINLDNHDKKIVTTPVNRYFAIKSKRG